MMKIGYIRTHKGWGDDDEDCRMQPEFYTEKEADCLDRWSRNDLTRILYVELPEE
jgi:hypothetical protein